MTEHELPGDVQEGQQPTHWQLGMQQLALDNFKQSLPLCNDILTKLIILNTALLGTFTGLKELPVPIWFRVLAIIAFALSLAAALLGIYPRDWRIDYTVPVYIQAAYEDAIKKKGCWIRTAGICLIAGFLIALLGIIWGASTVNAVAPNDRNLSGPLTAPTNR